MPNLFQSPGKGGASIGLLCALGLCAAALLIPVLVRPAGGVGQAGPFRPAQAPAARPSREPRAKKDPPAVSAAGPSVQPAPSPIPADGGSDAVAAVAVPEGDARDASWFSDAVLIGDSRVNGFQLFSDVTGADYLTATGLTIYQVAGDEAVIRVGEEKISVLEALGQKQYAKVYLSMGVNELGYFNPEGYADTFASVVDRVRALQSDAAVYVMTIIPLNDAKCKEYKQADYINNDLVAQYNDALAGMAEEKDVYLVNAAEALIDGTGQVPENLSSDGVHFQKEGYLLWRDYLLCHTGE